MKKSTRLKRLASMAVAGALAFSLSVPAFAAAPDSTGAAVGTAKTVKVKSVKLNYTAKTLKKGKTVALKATITPKKATNKKVSWKSSNKKVATVTAKGLVKGKKNGKATITCTAKSNKKKATCAITVGTPVTKVALPKATSITAGKTATLKVTVGPKAASNKAVTWKSSDEKVATVTAKGVVKGIRAGTASITATAKDGSGKKATCKVTVKKADVAVSSVKLPATSTVVAGQAVTLQPTVAPGNATNKTLTWGTSDARTATVTAKGVVKGLKGGKATVTATSNNNKKGTCIVTVTDPKQKAVDAEAQKYKTEATIYRDISAGADITVDIISLKAGMTAGAGFDVSATVKKDTGDYLDDSTAGMILLKKQAAHDATDNTAIVTLTVAKDGKTATVDVRVTIVPQDSIVTTVASIGGADVSGVEWGQTGENNNPYTAGNILVAHDVKKIGPSDIVPTNNRATVHFYGTDSSFYSLTGTPVPLSFTSETTVYFVINASTGIAHYAASVKREANTDASVKAVLKHEVTSWTGTGANAENVKAGTLDVANSAASIAVGNIEADEDASVIFHGTDATFATAEPGAVSLTSGTAVTVYFTVTAEDTTTLFYALTITRDTSLSSDASVKTIVGENAPEWAGGTGALATPYAAAITVPAKMGALAPTDIGPKHPFASLGYFGESDDYSQSPVSSVALTKGTAVDVFFSVLAEDGTTTEYYKLSVTREADKVVDLLDLTGQFAAPAIGEQPDSKLIGNDQYTGTIMWFPTPAFGFETNQAYTATITLSANEGYTFTGVAQNSFSYPDATITNSADSSNVTVSFPTLAGNNRVTDIMGPINDISAPLGTELAALSDFGLPSSIFAFMNNGVPTPINEITWEVKGGAYDKNSTAEQTLTMVLPTGYVFSGMAAPTVKVTLSDEASYAKRHIESTWRHGNETIAWNENKEATLATATATVKTIVEELLDMSSITNVTVGDVTFVSEPDITEAGMEGASYIFHVSLTGSEFPTPSTATATYNQGIAFAAKAE